MAKRRKKSFGRRRRRIGALALTANSPLVKYGSLAAGYLMADKVNEQLAKVTGSIDPKIVNGILAAGGLYLLFMHKGRKNTIVTALAGLAAGAGTKGLLTDFGVISGFSNMPVIGSYADVPAIGNYNVPAPMINGVEGYNVPSVLGSVPENNEGSGINKTDR